MDRGQENWINSILKDMPAERIETAKGPEKWRSLLIGCLPDERLSVSLGLSSKQCFCFFGPHGAGKHTLALGYAGSAVENQYKVLDPNSRRSNHYIYVTGKQLLDSDNETAVRRVEALFRNIYEGHYVLIIEEPLELCVWEKIVAECRKLEKSASMTVIVIESREEILREEWKDALTFCRFDLPDYDERMAYFSRQFGKRVIRFPENDILADYTEGFNYYELNSFVNLIGIKLKKYLSESYNSVKEVELAVKNRRVELDESECLNCRNMVKDGRCVIDHTPEAIHIVIDGGGVMAPVAMQSSAVPISDRDISGIDDKMIYDAEDLMQVDNDEETQLFLELGSSINAEMMERIRKKGLGKCE